MRYIRTKYGIFGFEKIEWQTNLCSGKKFIVNSKPYGNFNEDRIWKDDLIKQADTIEELCDLYVIWLKNRELPLFERIRKGFKPHLSYFETSECSFDEGYGAIWTDKGLIYVAKINDKGEFELL